MDARLIERIETNVERAASALFGAAIGYSVYGWLSAATPQPELGAYSAGAGALGYLLCTRTLKTAMRRRGQFRAPVFDVREIETFETDDELLLTDRLEPATGAADGEALVLDDILTEIGPDARVVRLFDRKAMPTAGQLQSRIDDHLGVGPGVQVSPDASQALSAALAELRRSLR